MGNSKTRSRRNFFLSLVAGAAGVACPPLAFGGAWTGGSTEYTQIRNNLELMLGYALQVEQFIVQGKQFQTQLTNLIANPLSLLGPEVGQMINGIGQIMAVGNSIGSTMAQIDRNFAATFKNPTAQSLSDNFAQWHSVSTDTLQASLKAAGLQNEQYADETSKIQALYDQSQNSSGNLSALQSLAAINTHQLQQMQSLGQLISTQNIAASTYMAEHDAREQALHKAGEINFKAVPMPDKSTYKTPTF